MTKRLSEAQAWRRIAERVDAQHDATFLCLQLHRLYQHWEIPHEVWQTARQRIAEYLKPGEAGRSAYNSNVPWSEARGGRVLAALWLALDAEDEARRARQAKRSKPRIEPRLTEAQQREAVIVAGLRTLPKDWTLAQRRAWATAYRKTHRELRGDA